MIKGNINKLHLIRVCKWFMLYMPVIALFYMENGLTVGDIMLVQAIYSTAVAFFELPSGYFSDNLGRKRSIIIGMFLLFCGFGLLSLSYHFWAFATGAVIMGVGSSFISGTDSALLYDSLVAIGQEKKYLKYEGRNYSIGTFSEAIAAIFGGWLAYYAGLRATLYAQLFITFTGFLIAFTLVEVQQVRSGKHKGLANIRRILRYTFIENTALRWYIFLSASIGSATLTMAWFAQPFFKELGFSAGWIGNIWSVLNLTVAALAFMAHYSYRFIDKKPLILLIVLGISLSYLGIGFNYSYLGLVFVFTIYMIRGIATPVLLDFVNQLTPSDMRATVLSMRSFFIRMVFSIIAPFMGWVTDVYSLQQAFVVAGVSFGAMGLVCVFVIWGQKLGFDRVEN